MKIMRKLKKLIFHPKKFFKDSFLFKVLNGDIAYVNAENLFIISHLGQLHQIEKLIEFENIKDSILIILYTKKNTKVPNSIKKQVNKSLFTQIILFELPSYPNRTNLKSLFLMKNSYYHLIDNISPKNLYVLSFENHYNLLLDYALKNKINVNLVDEGTATYKQREQSEYYIKVSFLKYIILKAFNMDAVIKWHTAFTKIYASFPELLKNTFSAKEYIKFFSHGGNLEISTNTKTLAEKYNITSNDFIYVNQRYPIDNNDFIASIILILNKISQYYGCKIFVKMHPKDTESLQSNFKLKIKNNKTILFIEENEFLIEETIQYVQPKGIIGVTSTALVNAPLISPLTISISITPWFLSLLREKNTEIIKSHYDILKLFNHINHIKSENDLVKLSLYKQSKIYDENYNFKQIAKTAYIQDKHKKAIINYIWAYPRGIKSMPEDDFIKFIDATINIYNIKVVSDIYNTWINYIIINEKEIKLEKYLKLLDFITKIINANIAISKNRILVENIFNSTFALITACLSQNKCNIERVKEEYKLLNNSKDKLLFLQLFRIEDYILTQEYQKAESLIKNIIEENDLNDKEEILQKKLLECLIRQNKIKEAKELNQYIQEHSKVSNNIKLICQSIIDIENEKYGVSLNSLFKVTDELILDEKKVLKVELLISRVYRYKEDYVEAQKWLILFEKHSKGDIECCREIAYLEYEWEKYQKAIAQFKQAYLRGIKSMPEDDFIKFINAYFSLEEYAAVSDYLCSKTLNHIILKYYYLYSLFQLKKYNEFLKKCHDADLSRLKYSYLFNIRLFEIKIYKRKGMFKKAYTLLMALEYNKIEEIDRVEDILDIIDLYEVNDDFYKAYKLWKVVLTKFDNKPLDAWERFYNNKRIISKS